MTRGSRAPFAAVTKLLDRAQGEVFPAFSAVVSAGGDVVFQHAAGASCVGKRAVDSESVFDLASLTKPLVTVSLCMHFADLGLLPLDRPAAELLAAPVAGGLGVTPRSLLTHSTGLAAWRPLHLEIGAGSGAEARRRAILAAACDTPASEPAGTKALYSDLNFMILTALLEKIGGARLDALFSRIVPSHGLFFRPLPGAAADRRTSAFVASEDDPARGLLAGQVNDENAWAMGGVSGHAGLFGTARDVHTLVGTLLAAWRGRPSWIRGEVVREFWTKQHRPAGSTWALGWDTPSKTGSSAGTAPPPGAVGHTGFTGGSIWVDPEREAITVLLTNRTWPDRTNDSIRAFRPRFHDAVWAAVEKS